MDGTKSSDWRLRSLVFVRSLQIISKGNGMKTVLGAAAGLLALGAALPVSAADLPPRLPAYPAVVPYYSWTGFYIGGDIGGAWTIGSVTDSTTGAIWGTGRSNWIGG